MRVTLWLLNWRRNDNLLRNIFNRIHSNGTDILLGTLKIEVDLYDDGKTRAKKTIFIILFIQ